MHYAIETYKEVKVQLHEFATSAPDENECTHVSEQPLVPCQHDVWCAHSRPALCTEHTNLYLCR